MKNVNDEEPKVKSLYKALQLLDYFDEAHPEISLAELSEMSGMLKSSVFNMLSTMASLGYIAQNEKTRQYRLGYKFHEKSYILRKISVFQNQVRPLMEKAAGLTGESVTYAVRRGIETVYMDTAYPAATTTVRLNIGARYPLYSTAGGKAILANSGDEVMERVKAAGFTAYTENTITDPERLEIEMEKIRRQGYSIDNMENEFGIRGLAVAIWSKDKILMGAVSLSGPSLRISDERIPELVKIFLSVQEEAKNISG